MISGNKTRQGFLSLVVFSAFFAYIPVVEEKLLHRPNKSKYKKKPSPFFSRYLPLLLKGFAIGATLASVVVAADFMWHKIDFKHAFQFNTVRVENETQHIQASAVAHLVAENLEGGFFTLNVEKLKTKLLQDPWIANVSFRRVWPGLLKVSVVEKQPVAQWGDSQLVSVEGELFTPPATMIPEGLPKLTGPKTEFARVLAQYQQAMTILQSTNLNITALKLSDQLTWQVELNNRFHLTLGSDDLDVKLRHFIAMLPTLQHDYNDANLLVDLRYPNGAAVMKVTS